VLEGAPVRVCCARVKESVFSSLRDSVSLWEGLL
jgi:hypothetical protein